MGDVRKLFRSSDPETSVAAAGQIEGKINAIQAKVLAWAREVYPRGFSDAELEQAFPEYGPSTVRTRRRELVDAGFIEDSGFRIVNKKKRTCIVWRAVWPELSNKDRT